MIETTHKKGAGYRVLFLGRHQCPASQKILEQLHQCGFDITYAESRHRQEKLSGDILGWQGDYILCYRSFFVLPEKLLGQARVAAINFHPGPPEYPGSGCINFALYDEVHNYGVTAHLMNAKIDNGKILEVRRFPVSRLDSLSAVLEKTHRELYRLCSDFVHALASHEADIIEEKAGQAAQESWKGKARRIRKLDQLSIINPDIDKSGLERIIRATYTAEFPPRIVLHGYHFYLKLDDENA